MAASIETETTITGVKADGYYLIGTNWSTHILRLDKEVAKGRAQLVSDRGDWKEYRVSAEDFNPVGGFKRKLNLSEDQKEELAERMRKLHSKS